MEPRLVGNIAHLLLLSVRAMHPREENFMTNRFLISTAVAALIAGTSFANAQGTGASREGTSGGAATQQTAPSSGGAMDRDSGMKGAESAKGSESKDMKASESHDKTPSSKSAQDTKSQQGEKSKSMTSENETKSGKDMKAESHDKSGNMNAQTKSPADTTKSQATDTTKSPATSTQSQTTQSPAGAKSQTTTGNAATSAAAAPPPEKQTQIVSAIKTEKIQETTNVNFNISVGTMVPATVRFHPLPPRIVEIYPEWRGYDVVLVHGRYIIVRPHTHEIVYIIEG
jgi:Protein of unknown function (DUF1236)